MNRIQFPLLLILLTGFTACKEKITAPIAVKNAFSAKYPTASDLEWEMESPTEYEAEFEEKGSKKSAVFTVEGTWKETGAEIKKSDLPTVIIAVISSEFPGYEIEKAETVETPTIALAYEVEVELKGENMIDVLISTDGQILKEDVKTEEDEN